MQVRVLLQLLFSLPFNCSSASTALLLLVLQYYELGQELVDARPTRDGAQQEADGHIRVARKLRQAFKHRHDPDLRSATTKDGEEEKNEKRKKQ